MTEMCQFHLLTFVTKYSRLPSEEIALKRYNAMMEIGKKSLMLDAEGSKLIGTIFKQEAKKLGIEIIVENILSDHAHIVIDTNDKPMSEIVQRLKGCSAFGYNRTFQHSGPIWAAGYSDTYLDNETHLKNAIEYVRNNHLKHQIETNYVRDSL